MPKQLVVKSLEIRDDEKNIYVEGYASAAVEDLDGEIISEEALKKVVEELVNPPYNKVFLDHAPLKRDAPATEKIPVGVIVDAKVKDGKLWIKAKLNKAHPLFEIVYKSLKEKFIDAFSIGFKTLKSKRQGKTIVITELKVLEVSLVGVPANPEAIIESVYEKQFIDEDEIEEKHPRAGGRRHRTLNRIASRLVRLGKFGLRRKCISCDDDDDIALKDYSSKAESECKPPEETGGRMEAETCSGWVDESGRELTWAEFKRRLAEALGIKPTQYIRNILYAAWRQGLISTEEARALGLKVREEDKEKKSVESDSVESDSLKSLNSEQTNMSEDVKKTKQAEETNSELEKRISDLEARVKELEAENAKLKEENEKLGEEIKQYIEEKKDELISEIKMITDEFNEEELRQKDIDELKDIALKVLKTKVLKVKSLPAKVKVGENEGEEVSFKGVF